MKHKSKIQLVDATWSVYADSRCADTIKVRFLIFSQLLVFRRWTERPFGLKAGGGGVLLILYTQHVLCNVQIV